MTITKGGEVTSQIHGGGHAFAIYEVSKDTTRDELGQYLCPREDPKDIPDPALHTCNLLPANSDARRAPPVAPLVSEGRQSWSRRRRRQIAPQSVMRDWKLARAWLARELSR